MDPYIEYELSEEEYFGGPAINSTSLKKMLKSPQHYKASREEDNKPPTPAQQLGRDVHLAILEPERFEKECVALPEGFNGKRKDDAALKAQIIADGHRPIKAGDYAKITAIRDAVRSHPMAKRLFEFKGHNEASFFWDDGDTGLECRARLDRHIPPCETFPHGVIVDVKTTEDAFEEPFQRTIRKYEYDLSLAFYSDGFQLRYKTERPPAFYWIVVEKSAPYACVVYEASETYLGRGRMKYRKALDLVKSSQEAGHWPGYYNDEIRVIEPAPWEKE